MTFVRYVALAIVTLVVSALLLSVVCAPIIAWLTVITGMKSDALVFAMMAAYLLVPGLAVFGFVAPVLVIKDFGRGWWHLAAPLCFGAGSIFWYALATAPPYLSDDPKAGVVSVAFFQYSLPAVLAGLLGGSLAAASIETFDWFGP